MLRRWAQPVDGASLSIFRICFGLVMIWHYAKYLVFKGPINYVGLLYGNSVTWHFPFPGFEWIRPFAEPGMSLVLLLGFLAAVAVAIGFYYRISAFLLFILQTYIFFTEAAEYNNHYYLMCLVAFLLMVMPGDQRHH